MSPANIAAVTSWRREVERGEGPDVVEGRTQGHTIACSLLESAHSLHAGADDNNGNVRVM